ncbi:hypothetical protein JS521_36145, partial [Streptomyces sp. RHZ10]|nr:hypothetical protein [Streptomyces durocortorensis]
PPARPAHEDKRARAYRRTSPPSTYALYAATNARRATRSTGRNAFPRAAISDELTAPPCPFSYATETSSPTRCAISSTRTARGG